MFIAGACESPAGWYWCVGAPDLLGSRGGGRLEAVPSYTTTGQHDCAGSFFDNVAANVPADPVFSAERFRRSSASVRCSRNGYGISGNLPVSPFIIEGRLYSYEESA